jgi:circadian clock protein KaiB
LTRGRFRKGARAVICTGEREHEGAMMGIPETGATENETIVFQLFVAGEESHSKMAVNNLREICDSYLKDRCRIEIVDVYESFDIALENNIFLTPALIRVSPGPRITVFGNLSDTSEVLKALQFGDN